ncbi:MAG: DNA polymerase IV [Actinomycetota bacterium]
MPSRGRTSDRASILHADLDSFYASVEQRDDPALRGRPVAAGGGVVLAASYEAKRFGVRTAMTESAARRLCPDLVVVPARFEAYQEASERVFEVFHDTTPLVEGISIDEAFLDVSGLRRLSGRPVDIARRLRTRVRDDVGLPITVGVARTKFLAKVASGVGKPDGLLVVEPDGELDFLHPLAVDRLWGVGRVTAAKLEARGVHTVGDVAALDEEVLVSIVGRASGRQLHALSHNRDARRVETGRRRGSIGSQQALGRPRPGRPRSKADIDNVLLRIVDRVTRRMRRADRIGRTITLRFRFVDFERITRSHTLPQPTAATGPILAVARALLDAAWPICDERGLTLIGLSVGQLGPSDAVQLALPFERAETDGIDRAVDDVRERFGSGSLTRGSTVGHDPGRGVPLLPD